MAADEEGGRRKRERRRADDEISIGWLRDMVQTNDDKHEDGHQRLRRDFRSMEHRITALETAQVANTLHFTRLDSAPPPDVLKLRWDTRTVLAFAIAFASLAAGQVALNNRLEGNLSAKMDQRNSEIMRIISEIKAKQEMQDVKMNTLREMVIENSPKRR
jgi:hypothetical protein